MTTRLQLCGPVALEVRGRRIEKALPGRQGLLTMGFLILNRRRPVEREEVMEAIWPIDRPRAAQAALRALLSKLRRALGPDLLVGRDTLRLVLPADAWIDIEGAEEALHRAESALGNGQAALAWGPSRVAALIAERVLLPGHEAPWLDERRRELGDVRARALRCIATCGLALGTSELVGAERAARTLVELRPLDESAHLALMDVLAAEANAAEALSVYEVLRRRLGEELGTVPGPALRARHAELLGASAERSPVAGEVRLQIG